MDFSRNKPSSELLGYPHDYGNLRMDVLGIFHDLPIKNVDFP